tara:strand:- start:2474 stop:3142 length:669 start_codon:yes stop_codon:yes gene_type:complete
MLLSPIIHTLNVPSRSFVGDFAVKQAIKYEVDPLNLVCISEDLNVNLPSGTEYDMIIYNTSKVVFLNAEQLDTLLINTQASLRTLGMVVFNIPSRPRRESMVAYDYILDNPLELWDYNLVSVEVDDYKISARKGSSVIFKDRELLKLIPVKVENNVIIQNNDNTTELSPIEEMGFIALKTGDERTDFIVNMLGMFLQYTIIFNFFTFGIMLVMAHFIGNGPK